MNKRPKAIFLGGSYAQIPVLKEAKRRKWHIILCDYLPDNPGQKLADEYYPISTTDREAVLALSKKAKPDYVIAYASDPSAPTAAYVSEKLGLPGNTFKSIQLLSEKDLFRNFLKENGFNSPKALSITNLEELKQVKDWRFPVIVKPTDSSGSRGVSRVDNKNDVAPAFHQALSFSRNKRVIIEEFIDNEKGDIHGDGFVINGELAFCHLGDHIYSESVNIYNPCGTLWPSQMKKENIALLKEDLERCINLSGFQNGPINIEARINSKNQGYIMEIGARSGGHFVPQAIQYSTGFDMVKALLDYYEGKEIEIPKPENLFSAYYALYSTVEGILKEVIINPEILPFIKEFHQYVKPGEPVHSFEGANATIGILLFQFNSKEELNAIIRNIQAFTTIKLA